jgi:hypothetical protein
MIRMEISIYSARELQYLLLPSFLLPCNHDEGRYGPLVLCGHVAVDDDTKSILWCRLLAQIREHRSAAITASIAHRLLGDDHACLQPPMTADGTEGATGIPSAGG